MDGWARSHTRLLAQPRRRLEVLDINTVLVKVLLVREEREGRKAEEATENAAENAPAPCLLPSEYLENGEDGWLGFNEYILYVVSKRA